MDGCDRIPEHPVAIDWTEIDRIVAQALELAPQARATFVAIACEGRSDIATEVASLLRAEIAAADFMDCATRASEDCGSVEPPFLERAGAYRLVEEIGHGGMGVVYRAERDDGQFRKQAAVKLLATAWVSPEALRRFQAERQILATLDHPNVCRLLDGGVVRGVPYLVMEFIEGAPLLEYCRQHALGQRERLRLFRQLCGAVQYAHQHLIVHRDIKPGNILVTAEREVKLMDFGIAKVLAGAGDPDQTRSLLGAMTPDYASPEQLQRDIVTTQSDVYSLGVLLYELLTGTRPYTTSGKSLTEVLQIVLRTEPPTSGLPSELLAITRCAMAKEPILRYSSAAALDDDVARYLSAQPVQAVGPSHWYTLRKWIGRHRLAVVAGTIAALLIVTATSFALSSAAEARRERKHAEERFHDVEQLANKVLFDYPIALRRIDSSTDLQLQMANDSLQYLDNLSRAKTSDTEMLLNLAKGYVQIGIFLGTPRTGNLGHPEKAIETYTKARTILEDLLQRNPNSQEARLELGRLLRRTSQFDKVNASELANESLRIFEDLYRQQRDDGILFYIGWAHIRLAELDAAKFEQATKAVESLRQFLGREPNNINGVHQLAYAYRLLSYTMLYGNDPTGALSTAEAAKTQDERAQSLISNNGSYQMEISLDVQLLARAYLDQGHLVQARNSFELTAEMRRKVFHANPADEWVQERLLDALCWLGWIAERQRASSPAHASYREALKLVPELTAVQPNDEWNAALGFVYGSEGLLLKQEHQRREACQLLAKSINYFRLVRNLEEAVFQARSAEVAHAAESCE